MTQLKTGKIQIVLATHNKNKAREFRKILNKNSFNLNTLKNYTSKVPIENGNSFEENALIKARFASKLLKKKIYTISDDSGLCIKNLKNEPGIKSARWAKDNNYKYAFKKIKEKLEREKKDLNKQKASFVCVIALIDIKKNEFLYKGELEGRLIFPPKGTFGFGYDPIFIPKGYNTTLAEMPSNIKNKISHRRLALEKLLLDHKFN